MEDRLKWEGRAWLNWARTEHFPRGTKITFLSYHVFADFKCTGIRYSTTKSWEMRRSTLLSEILNYDADIICLQDVDHFSNWWQPQLMLAGYDTVWKKRTSVAEDHYEGVVIGYRRDIFQLFKTVEVDLNNAWEMLSNASELKTKLQTDDVGLIIFLQPWATSHLNSAICVGCCMFDDSELGGNTRLIQSQYFARSIELANRDYQLPVLLGVSLHDEPSSKAYHLLRSGRVSMTPQAPRKCLPPRVEPFCRGSATVYWLPPDEAPTDPVILAYKLCWRPGGSETLGFNASVTIDSGSCIRYTTESDEKGVRRTVAQKERVWVVTNLTSDLSYEFKVLAVNEVGEGPWSDASEPILLPNPQKV